MKLPSPKHTTFNRILELYHSGHRQEHPCTCGPASVSLVAQALGCAKKPESAWLAPELSRWVPVEQFTTKRGMALHEANFTTEMVYSHNLDVQLRRAFPENIALFKADLEEAATRDDIALVMNFTQDHALSQPMQGQGSPHFSPISGYDTETGEILVCDVDFEIPTPYWISVERAFESMAFINPAFKMPRGWLRIRSRK